MARKTVKDLEEENRALKEKLANAPQAVDTTELEAENEALRESVELNKQAKDEAEARLTAAIEDMEKPVIVNGQVQGGGMTIFHGNEYTENLIERGIKIHSKFDIETLRSFINSNWTPSMVMEKFGLSKAELQSWIYKLSKREMRDTPIMLNFQRDQFGRQG